MIRWLFTLFLLYSFALTAQEAPKKWSVLPVPALGYTPETEFYVGAVGLFTWNPRGEPRSSNAKLEFNYTWNNQSIADIGWNLLGRQEQWFTSGNLRWAFYPDRYYGWGSNTPDSNETWFDSRRWTFDGGWLWHTSRRWFVGPWARWTRYSHIQIQSEQTWNELKPSESWGLGGVLLWDGRNNLLTPTQGAFGRLMILGLQNNQGGQAKITLDGRKYLTWKKHHTLAVRNYWEFNPGQPTFFDAAIPGGDALFKGLLVGRFRNNHMGLVQAEWRSLVWWRLGLTAFGGALVLTEGWPLEAGALKWNGGMGLRFLVDRQETIYLRLDYGLSGDGQNGFYIAFGESF
jgi:hypothetical protein